MFVCIPKTHIMYIICFCVYKSHMHVCAHISCVLMIYMYVYIHMKKHLVHTSVCLHIEYKLYVYMFICKTLMIYIPVFMHGRGPHDVLACLCAYETYIRMCTFVCT